MTNVLEWLEHMEGQAGEKIAVADPKEKYSFTQLKTYAQKSGTYLRKWMTGTFPVAIYMEKSCATLSIMLGAVYAGCPSICSSHSNTFVILFPLFSIYYHIPEDRMLQYL